MGHLLILTWIKVHFIQNIFTGLEFSNFTIIDPEICFKIFWKGENYLKALEGFELSNPIALRC